MSISFLFATFFYLPYCQNIEWWLWYLSKKFVIFANTPQLNKGQHWSRFYFLIISRLFLQWTVDPNFRNKRQNGIINKCLVNIGTNTHHHQCSKSEINQEVLATFFLCQKWNRPISSTKFLFWNFLLSFFQKYYKYIVVL